MSLSEKLECQRQAREENAPVPDWITKEIAILKEAGVLLDKVLEELKKPKSQSD